MRGGSRATVLRCLPAVRRHDGETIARIVVPPGLAITIAHGPPATTVPMRACPAAAVPMSRGGGTPAVSEALAPYAVPCAVPLGAGEGGGVPGRRTR